MYACIQGKEARAITILVFIHFERITLWPTTVLHRFTLYQSSWFIVLWTILMLRLFFFLFVMSVYASMPSWTNMNHTRYILYSVLVEKRLCHIQLLELYLEVGRAKILLSWDKNKWSRTLRHYIKSESCESPSHLVSTLCNIFIHYRLVQNWEYCR